ncbi:TPA: hypothetical protein ACV5UU_001441 [Klebsiella michiganensis]|jgi:hypothetical protein
MASFLALTTASHCGKYSAGKPVLLFEITIQSARMQNNGFPGYGRNNLSIQNQSAEFTSFYL